MEPDKTDAKVEPPKTPPRAPKTVEKEESKESKESKEVKGASLTATAAAVEIPPRRGIECIAGVWSSNSFISLHLCHILKMFSSLSCSKISPDLVSTVGEALAASKCRTMCATQEKLEKIKGRKP